MSLTRREKLIQHFKDSETVDIALFYEKFNFPIRVSPTILPREVLQFRANFIAEEMDELFNSLERGDILDYIDALVDIVVVVKGTAAMMGLRWNDHWQEVLRANMQKEPGKNAKRPDMPFDLIKPPGWPGPNHRKIFVGDDRE